MDLISVSTPQMPSTTQVPRPQITNATQDNDALNINYDNLFHCGNGFIANISMDFRLLENGSLFILSPSEILIPEEDPECHS